MRKELKLFCKVMSIETLFWVITYLRTHSVTV